MTSNNNNNDHRGGEDGSLFANKYYDDWVKEQMPDLNGKVAVITGANSGTGFWAAMALAGKGCRVVLACRNPTKAAAAKKEILHAHPQAQVDASLTLDGMDFASVRTFAQQFDTAYERLDYLLNNAGIMAVPFQESKDGFESQIQTNHLSHFLLTKLLWHKIVATPGQSRIVQHSSAAHIFAHFDANNVDDPSYNYGRLMYIFFLVHVVFPLAGAKNYDRIYRYGQSKLANVLFMQALKQKIDNSKNGLQDKVISVACHPGSSSTNLQSRAHGAMPASDRGMQSAADGALPLLMAAVGGTVRNGDYIGPSSFMYGPPSKASIMGYGHDAKMANSLWTFSEECIKDKFVVE